MFCCAWQRENDKWWWEFFTPGDCNTPHFNYLKAHHKGSKGGVNKWHVRCESHGREKSWRNCLNGDELDLSPAAPGTLYYSNYKGWQRVTRYKKRRSYSAGDPDAWPSSYKNNKPVYWPAYFRKTDPGVGWGWIEFFSTKAHQPVTAKRCADGHVRAQNDGNIAAGVAFYPEVHYDSKWYPICGQSFWDTNAGASSFCQMLGYASGAVARTGATFSVDAMPVGSCGHGQKLTACTGGHNAVHRKSTSANLRFH